MFGSIKIRVSPREQFRKALFSLGVKQNILISRKNYVIFTLNLDVSVHVIKTHCLVWGVVFANFL